MTAAQLKAKLDFCRAQSVGVYQQRQDLERQKLTIQNQIIVIEATLLKLDGQEEVLVGLLTEQTEFERVDAENKKKAEEDRLKAEATKPTLVDKVVDKLVAEKKNG